MIRTRVYLNLCNNIIGLYQSFVLLRLFRMIFFLGHNFPMPTFESKCWYMVDNLKVKIVDVCTPAYDRKTFKR